MARVISQHKKASTGYQDCPKGSPFKDIRNMNSSIFQQPLNSPSTILTKHQWIFNILMLHRRRSADKNIIKTKSASPEFFMRSKSHKIAIPDFGILLKLFDEGCRKLLKNLKDLRREFVINFKSAAVFVHLLSTKHNFVSMFATFCRHSHQKVYFVGASTTKRNKIYRSINSTA